MAETFGCFVGVKPDQTSVKMTDETLNGKFDISGGVVFIKDFIEASFYLRFKKETLFKLLGPVYGEEFTELNSRVIGGMGELVNAIYGLVKVNLSKKYGEYGMALPIVIVGETHPSMMELNQSRLVMEYDFSGERAVVEVILGKNNQVTFFKAS
jgi:CheY-specific phosphatase CheX